MPCINCEQTPCECPRSRHPRPAIRTTYTPQEAGISLEEFGEALFDAIKLVGSIQALDEQIGAIRHNKIKQAEARSARTNLLMLLKVQRDNLTVDQTLELVEHYPWVAHV